MLRLPVRYAYSISKASETSFGALLCINSRESRSLNVPFVQLGCHVQTGTGYQSHLSSNDTASWHAKQAINWAPDAGLGRRGDWQADVWNSVMVNLLLRSVSARPKNWAGAFLNDMPTRLFSLAGKVPSIERSLVWSLQIAVLLFQWSKFRQHYRCSKEGIIVNYEWQMVWTRTLRVFSLNRRWLWQQASAPWVTCQKLQAADNIFHENASRGELKFENGCRKICKDDENDASN